MTKWNEGRPPPGGRNNNPPDPLTQTGGNGQHKVHNRRGKLIIAFGTDGFKEKGGGMCAASTQRTQPKRKEQDE